MELSEKIFLNKNVFSPKKYGCNFLLSRRFTGLFANNVFSFSLPRLASRLWKAGSDTQHKTREGGQRGAGHPALVALASLHAGDINSSSSECLVKNSQSAAFNLY